MKILHNEGARTADSPERLQFTYSEIDLGIKAVGAFMYTDSNRFFTDDNLNFERIVGPADTTMRQIQKSQELEDRGKAIIAKLPLSVETEGQEFEALEIDLLGAGVHDLGIQGLFRATDQWRKMAKSIRTTAQQERHNQAGLRILNIHQRARELHLQLFVLAEAKGRADGWLVWQYMPPSCLPKTHFGTHFVS